MNGRRTSRTPAIRAIHTYCDLVSGAVLSGILTTQEQMVLHAHLEFGLELDFRLRLGDWSVLVLRQPQARVRRQTKTRPRSPSRAR